MQFFRSRLSRIQSDAMVDHIQKHFIEHGFGLWAIEVPGVAPFIGFAGLEVPGFSAHFTPCVEVGWRLAFEHWGHGYATEAARLALGHGFGTVALGEVVSYTPPMNRRSRAVMERLGMRRDPANDFDYNIHFPTALTLEALSEGLRIFRLGETEHHQVAVIVMHVVAQRCH
jgi:RimJ/RimL family protein N-acetyltransferase